MSKLDSAIAFAALAHAGQFRKHSNLPYIVHPIEVMQIVAGVTDDQDMLIAAVLHDVVEDTSVATREIERRYGERVAALVYDLTEQPVLGNRAVRKAAEADRLSLVSNDAKTIKLADLISNTKDIAENDPGFAPIYLAEKRVLLSRLRGGSEHLMERAERQLVSGVASVQLRELVYA